MNPTVNPTVTEPVLVARSWVYDYPRPRRGWPNLRWPRYIGPDEQVQVRKARVRVSCGEDGAPRLDSVSLNGYWAGSRRETGWLSVAVAEWPDGFHKRAAPDWIMDEIVPDALRRAAENGESR